MPSPAAEALSMIQSILLFLGQSVNHDNALYISNYYMNSITAVIQVKREIITDLQN
jgi:hypothetical protein